MFHPKIDVSGVPDLYIARSILRVPVAGVSKKTVG